MPAIDDKSLAEGYDELPLWSAPFGFALLDAFRLRPTLTLLDMGCGTGFPLRELGQRIGSESTARGVDPWAAALVPGDRFRLRRRDARMNGSRKGL